MSTADRDRDRDPAGRARSARPRDGLGRPLPYGTPGVARETEGVVRGPDQTLAQAQRLLDAGLPFHAHEVFEDAWKSASGAADRALWKALAQLAVGCTHAARGNRSGAATLLNRGAQALEPFLGRDPFDIDVAGVIAWARRSASSPAEAPAPVLRPRLAGPTADDAGPQ